VHLIGVFRVTITGKRRAFTPRISSSWRDFDLFHDRVTHFSFFGILLLALSIGELRDFVVLAVKILGNLFHGCVASLDKVSVDDEDFESQEDTIEDVILPRQSLESGSIAVLVKEKTKLSFSQ
jgi:hypothetical protein